MNIPPKSVRNFHRHQRFRIAVLVAAAAITFVGWCWMSLETNNIWLGAISPSGKKFITYTYNEITGWEATQVRDVETGKVLDDLSRFHFSWSIAWADDATLVGTVLHSDASQSGDKIDNMLTIRLDEGLTVLDQKQLVFEQPTSLRVTSDGDIAFAVVENESIQQPRYVEICKTPLIDGAGDNKIRVLSRLEFGNDEEAFLYNATHTERHIMVVNVSPAWGATPKGNFFLTDGVSKTTLVVDLKTGEVLHEVRGGYEPILQSRSNDFLAKETTTGIDVYRIDNVSEAVATFPPKDGGKLSVTAFGERWKVIREETPSNTTYQVFDGHRDSPIEFRFADWTDAFLSGTNLFVMAEGKLDRIDLEQSYHKKQLVDVRRFSRLFAITTLLGIPLFVLCLVVGLVRAASRETFFDVAFACTLAAGSFAVWGQAAARDYEVFFQSMTFGCLGAAFAVLLVWVSTSKAIFGLCIPLVTIALAAAILFCKMAWSDSGGAGMTFVVLSLLILFQSGGQVLFRQFVGTLVAGDIDVRTQTQFSVRQVGIFTAAFAVLLACLRFVSFADPPPISVIIWLVLFAGAYSTCVLLSQWCALRLTNRFASFMLSLVGAIATLGCLHLINRSMMLNPGLGGAIALPINAQPIIAAMVVWTTLQIARRAGYRLHRATSNAAVRNVA